MPLTGLATGARGYGMFGAVAAAPAFESIATVTVSGTVPTVTFSSIPSNYASLQIRLIGRSTWGSAKVDCILRINGVSTSSYAYHLLKGDGSSASASGAASQMFSLLPDVVAGGSTSNVGYAAVIDLHDYSSTTRNKTIRAYSGYDANGSGAIALSSGLFLSSAAITSITFEIASGNWTTSSVGFPSTFALYGIKGAA